MIDSERLAEIRDTVSLFDVLEILDVPYEQSPRGDAWMHAWGREERTASVHVEERIWYDFGSGEGGDVFSFVQSLLGCTFGRAFALLDKAEALGEVGTRDLAPAKAKKEPVDLRSRLSEARLIETPKHDWLIKKIRSKHGVTHQMAWKWGLRIGPGDALWIPHFRANGEVNMVKVRDYRADTKKAVQGSMATGFYVCPEWWQRNPQAAGALLIVEGESDAWAAQELWPRWMVLGLPSGAGKFEMEWFNEIPNFGTFAGSIFICLDNDSAGEKATQQIRSRVACRVLEVPDPYTDINEAWCGGETVFAFEEVA